MQWIIDFSNSSIGRKARVGVTGLLLCAYLAIHLFGNLFVFGGRETFNGYAKVMQANPLLPAIELALLAVFVLHIVTAIAVTIKNRQARPVAYEVYKPVGRSTSSAFMVLSGVVLLAFLVVHVRAFRFLDHGDDLYGHEFATLSSKPLAVFYLVALAALFPHLNHGFQSAFNTLGINHPRYTPLIKKTGTALSLLTVLGFAAVVLHVGICR